MTPFEIYFVLMADGLKTALSVAGILGMSASFLAGGIIGEDGRKKARATIWGVGLPLFFLVLIVSVLTPNTKTLVAMYGGPAAIEYVTGETGEKAVKVIDLALDKAIEKLSSEDTDKE